MGNQKFKLSDMISNVWFYKLKDITKPSKTQFLSTTTQLNNHHRPLPSAPPSSPPTSTNLKAPPPQCQARKSYHFTRELKPPPPSPHETLPLCPPRKSKSLKSKKPTKKNNKNNHHESLSSPVSSNFSCKPTTATTAAATLAAAKSHVIKSNYYKTHDGFSLIHHPTPEQNTALPKTEHFDIVIDIDKESLSTESSKVNKWDFDLPPIITKPRNFSEEEQVINGNFKEQRRRFSVNSPVGMRLKINSPRVIGRKQGQNGNYTRKSLSSKRRRNKSISESFAVVKSSYDPQRDFRESMMEMIVQNKLRATKDLEDLLACYLLLNSDEYHDVIINAFKQIWFDF